MGDEEKCRECGRKLKRCRQITEVLSTGRHVPAAEDWYPTFEDGCVRVGTHHYDDGMLRIFVWGGDDTGMEFDTYDPGKFESVLRRIGSVIFKADLLAIGFKWA